MFALVWGIGGFLENTDRLKFDSYIKEKYENELDLPQNNYKSKDVSLNIYIYKFLRNKY